MALTFVTRREVGDHWSAESCLPGMTVGSLSGHLLNSGVLLVDEALDASGIPDGPTMTATRILSLVPIAAADPVHAHVRAVAEAAVIKGHTEVVEHTKDCLTRLRPLLEEAPPTCVVAFRGGSFPMTLNELLRSRILELVVHLDDLACSVEIVDLPVSDEALRLVCHLGIDIKIERNGSAEVLRGLFRPDGSGNDALRTF